MGCCTWMTVAAWLVRWHSGLLHWEDCGRLLIHRPNSLIQPGSEHCGPLLDASCCSLLGGPSKLDMKHAQRNIVQ